MVRQVWPYQEFVPTRHLRVSGVDDGDDGGGGITDTGVGPCRRVVRQTTETPRARPRLPHIGGAWINRGVLVGRSADLRCSPASRPTLPRRRRCHPLTAFAATPTRLWAPLRPLLRHFLTQPGLCLFSYPPAGALSLPWHRRYPPTCSLSLAAPVVRAVGWWWRVALRQGPCCPLGMDGVAAMANRGCAWGGCISPARAAVSVEHRWAAAGGCGPGADSSPLAWMAVVCGGERVGTGMAATCVVQPIDLIKTRMQLASAGPAGVKPYV